MKRILILFYLLIFTNTVSAEIIKKIEITGNERVSDETVKVYGGIEINQDIDNFKISEIIKSLYSTNFFADINNAKAILINPAIPPLKGFEEYLGENENYSTGEKFNVYTEDIKFLRSLVVKEFNNQKNLLVLLESGDEVLNYAEAVKYFKGSNIDITFGGSHSYESMANKLEKIVKFLEI